MKKRGQVTIFIILGIVIVAGVVFAVLYFTGKTSSIIKTSSADPNSFLTTCLQDSIKQAVNDTAFSGGNGVIRTEFTLPGEINPTNISYLCYTLNSGEPCTNLYSLFSYFENSLKSNLQSEVQICYHNLIDNLRKQNDILENNFHNFTVNVAVNRIVLKINADVTTRRKNSENGSAQRYQNFEVDVPSQAYEMLHEINEMTKIISSPCATFISPPYPTDAGSANYNIVWYNPGQSTVYIVKDLNTGFQFNFASRSCVMPVA